MAQRSECLYKDEIIGIESIYTVINGKQINIPEKVESLRKKGRDGLLFCPCGCGTKLILVAGDRNLREQHFRIQDGTSYNECTFKQEGQISIDSKIVIKCWLNDKVSQEVETRVPISAITNSNRKYELTHYVRNRDLAINYTNIRNNIEDEKLNEIVNSLFSTKTYYIVDIDNKNTYGQYPEFMMKIQNKQSYCLFLEIEGRDYEKAKCISAFYEKDLDGLYQYIELSSGLLSEYSFDNNNNLLFNGVDAKTIYNTKYNEYIRSLEIEKAQRIERLKRIKEEQERNERIRKEQEEIRKKELEIQKAEQQRLQEERRIEYLKYIQQQKEQEIEDEKKQIEAENEIKEKVEKEIDAYISKPYIDALGRNWYKCEFCGKVGVAKDFAIYGGPNKNARGTCHDCIKTNANEIDFEIGLNKNKLNADVGYCPECGCKLVKRKGKYGEFLGCSSFPICKYTEKL